MISKLSLAALALPLVSALQIQVPENPMTDSQVTIKFTKESGDPDVFDFQLTNDIFHQTFAIANTVNSADGSITLLLPSLPVGDGYTVIANQVGNINGVIGQTPGFSVAAASASSSSSSASASGSSGSAGASSTGKASSTAPFSSMSTAAFGSTVKASASSVASGASSAGSAAAGAASSSAAPNAAVKFNFSLGASAVAVLSAVAGAAALAL